MKRGLRILYITGAGEFGGAEQHLLGLLKSMDRSRFSPHVAVFYDAEFAAKVRELGVPVTYLRPSAYYFLLGGISRFRRLVQEVQPDIIHTSGVRGNLVGRLTNLQLGRPAKLVTTVHSILRLDYPVLWKRWMFMQLEKWTQPLVDIFILVSHAMKKEFVREGLDPSRAVVIHNGIELPATPPARPAHSALREELGLPQNAFIFGTVARAHEVKGHRYLLDAAQRMTDPNAYFVWVGGGDLLEELKSQVAGLGLTDRIRILGTRRDVPQLLPQFDAFVLPSLSEGLSVALLEAMAAGVPVITTAVGGSPEIVTSGEDGLLIPSKNADALLQAMRLLLEDAKLRKKLAAAGVRRVYDAFSLQRLAEETQNFYQNLIKEA